MVYYYKEHGVFSKNIKKARWYSISLKYNKQEFPRNNSKIHVTYNNKINVHWKFSKSDFTGYIKVIILQITSSEN